MAVVPVAEEVADLLHAVNRRVRETARLALDPLGVTPAQARALRVISRARPALRMSDVAERLHIAPRSATSVVDELTSRRLVARRADPSDRRAVTVELTSVGRSLLATLDEHRRAAAAVVVGTLPRRDLTVLRDLLRRLDDPARDLSSG